MDPKNVGIDLKTQTSSQSINLQGTHPSYRSFFFSGPTTTYQNPMHTFFTGFDFPCASFGTQQSELISTTFNAPTFNAPSIVDTSQHHHSSMHNLSQPSNLLQFHYGNLNENIPSQNHLDQNATRIATGGSFDIVPSNLQTGLTSDEKLCAVCSDRAVCQHYGARTCEGCKGFFKRTVQKKAQYMCTGNKNCTIDKRFRSRCQYCRYQKCLAVGMVKEVVRYGSLSGRRGRLPSKTKLLHSDDPPSPPLPLLTIINRAFADSRSTTASYTFSGLIEDLLEFLEEEFRSFLRFVDKIPRYTDLPRSDILMLTEKNFFALLALKLSNRWTKERKLRLDQVEIDVDSVPEPFKILFSKILQDIPQFRRVIERDSLAFAALLALQLLNAADIAPSSLTSEAPIDRLRGTITSALKDHCCSSSSPQSKKLQTTIAQVEIYSKYEQIGRESLTICLTSGKRLPKLVSGIIRGVSLEQHQTTSLKLQKDAQFQGKPFNAWQC